MEEKLGFGYYITIPTKIVQDDQLSPYAKLTFGVIGNLSNARGYCFATNKYLAKLLNLHENTVSRFVNELTNRGYLLRFDEIVNEQTQRRLFINMDVSGYINANTRGKSDKVPGVNSPVEHNNIRLITNSNNYSLSWFKSQIDEIYLSNIKLTHKGKNIEEAISQAYAHLAAEPERLHNMTASDCKRFLNGWLSNMKAPQTGGRSGRRNMTDEEFLNKIK